LKKDPYEVLGVPEGADDDTIKRAFRALVREHHPDVSSAPDSERRFRELIDAYERVAVPRGKRGRREHRADFSEIVSFYAWLASKQARTPPAEVPLAELELTPGEAVLGASRTIELEGPEGQRRTVHVEVPAGAWEGDRLVATGEDGLPALEVVVRVRRRRGSGRLVQAAAVFGLGWAVGLLVLVLTR
jgi:curved DNA-binding protein